MSTVVEAGVRPQTTYWVEETTNEDREPVAPDGPAFKAISNTVTTFDPSPQMEPDMRTGLGRTMAHDANRMQESHEISLTYDLERFPVDASGNVQDPYAYIARRGPDNQIINTVSLLRVQQTTADIDAQSTLHDFYFNNLGNSHPGGSEVTPEARPTRMEHYARGCIPSEAPLPLQPGDSSVVTIESTWTAPEFRIYEFDQPTDAGETLVVRSTDASDTGVTVTLETTDGGTNEELTLDSTDAAANYTTTSSELSSLRVSTDGTHAGNIEVYAEDGSGTGTPGQLLAVIYGETYYDGIEADSGVPMLGSSGSFEDPASVDWSPQYTLGSQTNFSGSEIGQTVTGATLTASNELSENNTDSGLFMDIRASTQEVTLETSIYGETDSYRTLADHLSMRQGELRMQLTDGEVVVPRAQITDPGTPAFETGSATAVVEAVWTALEPDGQLPVQFIHNDAA